MAIRRSQTDLHPCTASHEYECALSNLYRNFQKVKSLKRVYKLTLHKTRYVLYFIIASWEQPDKCCKPRAPISSVENVRD